MPTTAVGRHHHGSSSGPGAGQPARGGVPDTERAPAFRAGCRSSRAARLQPLLPGPLERTLRMRTAAVHPPRASCSLASATVKAWKRRRGRVAQDGFTESWQRSPTSPRLAGTTGTGGRGSHRSRCCSGQRGRRRCTRSVPAASCNQCRVGRIPHRRSHRLPDVSLLADIESSGTLSMPLRFVARHGDGFWLRSYRKAATPNPRLERSTA